MKILNEKVINSKEFIHFQSMIKKHYIENETEVSYEDFKKTLSKFIMVIMKSYLEDTEYNKDKYFFEIEEMSQHCLGKFDDLSNKIVINESVIREIYNGNINSMIHIFHELNHFKTKYDILLGEIDKNIIRIIKEKLLRIADTKLGTKMKIVINDSYYTCNYSLFSEEKIVEIDAIGNFWEFIKLVNISISDTQLQELFTSLENNINQYNIHLRDLRYSYNFNDNYLNFEDAFDETIKDYPEWLEYSQLNIEYYLKDGHVLKRNKEELEKRLETEEDKDIREYLQYLLKSSITNKTNYREFKKAHIGNQSDEINNFTFKK